MGIDVCPYFAPLDDPDTSILFPSSIGYCHRAEPAAPVRPPHQESFCLTGRHRQCPVFHREEAAPLPAELRGRPAVTTRGGRGWIWLPAGIVIVVIVLAAVGWGSDLFSGNGNEEPLPTRAAVSVFSPAAETATATATTAPTGTVMAAATETAVPLSSTPLSSLTPQPSATAVSPIIPTRTLTPTQTFTPTLTPTSQLTVTATITSPVPSPSVIVRVNRVNARTGPGLDYPVVTLVENGTEIPIVGRLNDGSWWQICCVEGRETPLWVYGETVDVRGDVDNVPVEPPPPLPTATPAP